ncbi:MAG: hypothetical protein ABS36_05465 [Acidobacteria bacterium SCN 69-37]|nr:MAG: hypothetical protein ABS36_05465 [Acidobacteria bacterium SCN 69-37]
MYRQRWCSSIALATILLFTLPPPPAHAQDDATSGPAARRTVTAVRLTADERVTLDGRLDEPFWANALPATDFIQQDPRNGEPATEPTEVRIVYTADALYFGVICFDSEPDRWIGYQRRRDEFLRSDDRFMWSIDTYLNGRTAYFFEMNPSGLMGDALRGIGINNHQWNGIWTGLATRDARGWILEVEIPFRTLNFDPDSDAWGVNFQRTVRRKNEESLWSGWLRNQGLNRMTSAGLLTGIHDVSQGHGLDIRPYGLVTHDSAPGRGDSRNRLKANGGVDLFYSLTPQLRAVATVNTDFAQTEVDQRQVNLTRFSLLFPERRDFFLDGSTFFDFRSADAGGVAGTVNPFFTRRIGLGSDGTPQRVNFGTKLTGQVGAHDIGVMHVRTGAEHDLAGEDFTALRLKRRLFSQSYVGGLYTRRAARSDGAEAAHTAGVDLLLGTSSFLGSQNLQFDGYYLHAPAPGHTGGQAAAYGATLAYPNDLWDAELVFREVQADFDPAVGFVTRTGYRLYAGEAVFGPRPERYPWLRQYTLGTEFDLLVDPATNRTLTRVLEFPLGLTLQSQDTLDFSAIASHERLEEDFDLGGAVLERGRTFDFVRYQLRASTADHRTIAVSPSIEWGEFFSGHRLETGLDLTLRLRPGLIGYLSAELNHVDLPETDPFTARLYRAVLETQFSPWIALVNNVQYDTQSAVIGWQSRFRWIVRPGNDLYIVYTHNWRDDPLVPERGFQTLGRRAASKVIYTLQF